MPWSNRQAQVPPPDSPARVVAPAVNHLLVDESKVWVVRGPRENRWRPAVDTLFRSAAVSHRNRVIGVILTGSLADGTAGRLAIKRCDGICIACRIPMTRHFPICHGTDWPTHSAAAPAIPRDLVTETRIARTALSEISTGESIGERTPFTCPDCGGVLWEVERGNFPRFRRNLLKTMSSGRQSDAASSAERISQAEEDIRRLRTLLHENESSD